MESDTNLIKAISERRVDIGEKPMVSISCLVYNHEEFLRKTLEGFLIQKVNFLVEILIHDDASTDKSQKIIKEYQEKFPLIIKPILQIENQYQKGLQPGLLNMERAQGKYYAMCEGDDYWTDPYKLQKQVNFLENHSEFSMCCGGYIAKNNHSGEEKEVVHSLPGLENKKGFSFGLEELTKVWLTKTFTSLYRKEILDVKTLPNYKFGRDIHLFYHLLKNRKGYYMKEVMGIHNIHEGGVNSMKKGKVNLNAAYNCYSELHYYNQDYFTRKKALKATLALLNFDLYNTYKDNTIKRKIFLYKQAFFLLKEPEEVRWFLNVIFPRGLKDSIKKNVETSEENNY